MTSAEHRTVLLPGGYFGPDDARHCDVRIRPLTGRDQEWAATISPELVQALFVTELLLRTVRSVGPFRATRQVIRGLSIGDREFLLLQLRAISFGGRVEMTLSCPDPECGAEMDASFDIGRVPVEAGEPAASYPLPGTDVRFRLPCGADQEEVAASGLGAEQAVTRVLARCVIRSPGSFDPRALADEIARLAPRVDFEMEAGCPECGAISSLPFDPTSWFIADLSRRHADFEREIHLLGFHYHWSLRELLGLSRERRTRYARLLIGELDRQASASYV